MSSEHGHHELPPEPSANRLLVSAAGWVGVILIIVLIFTIAYVYKNDGGPVDPQVTQRRLAIKEEVNAREIAAISDYGKAGENIRIPVARAMELVIADLNAKDVGPAPAAEQAPAPQPAAAPEAPAGEQGGSLPTADAQQPAN